MASDRPCSSAISREETCREIRRCVGTQFDPAVAATFIRIPPESLVAIQHGDANVEVVPDETEAAVLAIPGIRFSDREAAIVATAPAAGALG
jgi:HD-GYP domain-containing protein (c-di-GMP phosphodiesterase class II)